jgi:hypothetical protein
LKKPTASVAGSVPFVLVDKVSYRDESPWPGADGDGTSLQRRNANAYGNDPINWAAAGPSAGRVYSGGVAPTITSQPTNQTVSAFQSVTFFVGASGLALHYQWRHNGANLAGATNATLVLSNVQPSHYGGYDVVVFNSAGATSSSDITLNILVPPTITQQPQSRTVLAGASALFTVAASGTGTLSYQWRYNGTNVNGAIGTSFTLSNLTAADSGTIKVVVTDDIGFRESAEAVLTVLDIPTVTLEATPAYQEVLQGSTFTIAVSATGTQPLSYKWRRNNITIINQTNALLRITNAASANAGNYTVIITNVAGAVTSAVAVVVYQVDNDRDGMADNWERLYNFDTNTTADATLDFDGDKMNNVAEYIAGTDPTNSLSYLKVENLSVGAGPTMIGFFAVSNRTYSVLFKNALDAGAWSRLADTPARATNRVEMILDSVPGTNRFYRLVTPATN